MFHVAGYCLRTFDRFFGKGIVPLQGFYFEHHKHKKNANTTPRPNCDSKTYPSAQALEDTTYCTLHEKQDWPVNCYALVKT
jgi:hypothetical protein